MFISILATLSIGLTPSLRNQSRKVGRGGKKKSQMNKKEPEGPKISSVEMLAKMKTIDANEKTFFYQDGEGEMQGPFSKDDLVMWRQDLPMDLPVMIEKKAITKNGPIVLLAQFLGDSHILEDWRNKCDDGTRDPELNGYCIAPTAPEHEKEMLENLNHETFMKNLPGNRGIGHYWEDVEGGWQGPFDKKTLMTWRNQIPMDTALWFWNGMKFADEPEEFAVLIDEKNSLDMWRVKEPGRSPQEIGYGKAPTITAFEAEVEAENEQVVAELEKKEKEFGNSDKKGKERNLEDYWKDAFLDVLPDCPEKLAFKHDVQGKTKSKKELVRGEGFYESERDDDGDDKIPEHVQDELVRKRQERDANNPYKQSWTDTFIDKARDAENKNLYGELGLWMDPGKVAQQMEASYQARKRKFSAKEIAGLKERKRKVRQKMLIDWLHDDEDVGDLMYAREIMDPRAREFLRGPQSRRKKLEEMAAARGETTKPTYGMYGEDKKYG